jgi:hypothetical protein
MPFTRYSSGCPHRIALEVPRRPRNALNVEVGTPLPRCRLRPPTHWPEEAPSVTRWLLSGGSALMLGLCSCRACPLKPDFCGCGHMGTTHEKGRCLVPSCQCGK